MTIAILAASLWSAFSAPPDSSKPWCYYLWLNGHADRETITADLEAMRRLGFGGLLMIDSRGYWDDEEHVVNPKAELGWGTPQWYDLVEFSMRECARLGLEFTMNVSASGGTLNGFADGREYEVDVSCREDVIAHLDRAIGPLLKRVPDLVGKTFTHIYSVSYEGNVKTGVTWRTVKDTFYATMREWAHSHGLKVYSESGGPWSSGGSTMTKLDCDQIDMLAHNDSPQGEFWPLMDSIMAPTARHANSGGRFFQRAAVLAARREGRRIVSMEAFTHMLYHYSVDPACLKPLADISFADGANRLVWHTFTCSPKKFGVPGAEFFAGSHINRNVTWHENAAAFVKYLGRCQAMLQRGEYVEDGEFVDVNTNYYGWGRYRRDAKAQFTTTHRKEGDVDFFFVAGEGRGDVTLSTSCEGRTVEVWDAVTGRKVRLFTNDNCHKCSQIANANAGGSRFVATADGKTRVSLDLPMGGSCFVVFLPSGIFTTEDTETPLAARKRLEDSQNVRVREAASVNSVVEIQITNSWCVSFAYHEGISAAPPASIVMDALRDWTTYGKDSEAASTSLRYFSGTAMYRTTFSYFHNSIFPQFHNSTITHTDGRDKHVPPVSAREDARPPVMLSLGELPSGLAHVFVNGVDCGTVWCAPWEVDVSSALREGENELEIRYANNWHNRLVGDCFLPPEKRVTHTSFRYRQKPRTGSANSHWTLRPSVWTGPAISDPLQPSGLCGPVAVRFALKKPASTCPVSCIGLKRPWDPSPGWWEKRHAEKLAQIAASGGEIDLVFVGDSITHNWEGARGPGSDLGGRPLAELKKRYSVLNLGFGGDSTRNVLWRLENGELDGYRAKCFMLMIGTNNGDRRPEDTAAGIKAILDLIARKQPQAKTILLPIFPSGATADHPWRISKEKVNALIRNFADGEKVIWCDFNARFLNSDGTFPKGMMMNDNLHPLSPGYDIWAAEVAPIFRKVCGK